MQRVELFYDGNLSDLTRFFGSPERIEDSFNIEFSCGDGLFITDLDSGPLGRFLQYDGKIDPTLLRDSVTLNTLTLPLRFSFLYDDKADQFSQCRVRRDFK